ncbi:MAG: Release factor glutamine methyltransferase [candidate division TM6 bacterium GW2011_GWE2_41_16]|nr:MAG: Release factor glutamine methyltransferase [candidate division TM6 bacterium GW2011_GWE2_41_16]
MFSAYNYSRKDMLEHIIEKLEHDAGFEIVYATHCANMVCAYIFGVDKLELFLSSTQVVRDDEVARILAIVTAMIEQDKPLAYCLGTIPFLGVTIQIRPPILIPRVETEWWVDHFCTYVTTLKFLQQKPIKVIDMCTGSGCIGLAILNAFKQAQCIGADINSVACDLATINACATGLADRYTIVQSNLFEPFNGDAFVQQSFDFIVSNPPYISTHEWQVLDRSVKDWEDIGALVAADDGYALIFKILDQAPKYLVPHAGVKQLWIELGADQDARAVAYAYAAGYSLAEILKDQYGKDRVLVCAL